MSGVAAILGAGVIGAGWAARFALMGWQVRVFDPSETARATLEDVLARARGSLPALYDVTLPPEGAISWHETVSDAVAGAAWIQESVPERLDLKRKLYQAVQAHAGADAILASSTSGFTPSELQGCATDPQRIVVAHPFNPVYLLPLVELVGSGKTAPGLLDRAEAVLRGIGMAPLRIGAEVPAHVADRLLEAVWRESLWLVHDGVATTAEIDDAIRLGFGLRWAQMGLFETYRIAGGEGGMAHFLAQFGPALSWPWTKLMDVPDLDAALIARIAAQSDAQAGGRSIAALAEARDGNLVALLRALKGRGAAAGAVLNAHQEMLAPDPPAPETVMPVTLARQVPPDWADYNGHMNEARYLEAMSKAADQLLLWAGMTPEAVAAGQSVFTVETHLRHLAEVDIGDRIEVRTRVLSGGGKKLHLWHDLRVGERLCATGEQLLLHVDLGTRKAAVPAAPIADWLARAAAAHADRPLPGGLGRAVGDAR